MTPSLWILFAPLGAGALMTLRALARDRDPRHTASLALLGLLAARHIVSPPVALPSLDATLEADATAFLLDLSINLCAWLCASLTSRSIHERNRAEQLQWSGMEALRNLADQLHASATGRSSGAALDEAQELLAYGCEHLQFETGLLVQRSAANVEILVSQFPADATGLAPGSCPALADSLAARCFESPDVVVVDRASDGPQKTLPAHAPFAWESLLGLRILESQGTALSIVFADRKLRPARLGTVEKSLVTVMGHWLHSRAEAEAARAYAAASAVGAADKVEAVQAVDVDIDKPLTPTRTLPPESEPESQSEPPAEASRSFDLNRQLRRLEPKLQEAVGATLSIDISLSTAPPLVDLDAGAFERVATSLLLHAADTVADGGRLEVSTERIEAPEPGTPGFGTLAVKARGPALDADQLAALYEGRGEPDAGRDRLRLPLPSVVRLLRAAGGDLSLESEEGVGTTLTAFLPATADPAPTALTGPAASKPVPNDAG